MIKQESLVPNRPHESTVIEILAPDGHLIMTEHGVYTGVVDLEAHIDKLRQSHRQAHGYAIGFRVTRIDHAGKIIQVTSIVPR
jgi:hypothetical protein